MRTFEIILALLLLIRIILPVLRKDRLNVWISVGAFIVMLFHLVFEGFRWQMIPLYGITVGFFTYSIVRVSYRSFQGNNLRRIVSELLLFGAALLLPILLPIPRIPEPAGPYDVGTMTITLVDETRKELYSDVSDRPRILNVQFWYPAEPGGDSITAPWVNDIDVMGPALAQKLNLPPFFIEHIKYSLTHAKMDAALSNAESAFPIILFSHGWGGFKGQNTFQAEELASHGYIVAAPDHTYGAIATVLPDGRVAVNNPKALPIKMGLSDEEFLQAAQVLGNQWAGDLSHILDNLEVLKSDDPAGKLVNHLDFTNVGVFGHSTGGGAAIQFCATDHRCQAAMGMDPYMDPVSYSIHNQGLTQPYLAMFSEAWAQEAGRNNISFDGFYSNASGEVYKYYIKDTEHYDFTDLPAFSPLASYLGLRGKLDGEQGMKIINAYTLAFFDRFLKDDPGILLDHPDLRYPEVNSLP